MSLEYKLVACKASESEEKINRLFDSGWTIKEIVTERVSAGGNGSANDANCRGLIIFILEREKQTNTKDSL